jgi:diacylglycerol kinase family enzyme
VLDADGTIVVGNVYAGIDSVANAMINASRWIPAALLYRMAPVRAIATWRAATYTVVVDGLEQRVKAHTVVIANSGAYGHGLRIVPPAVLDDGKLDVMVVGDGPRRAVVRFLREAEHGTHVERAEVSLSTGSEVTISADRPLPVCADGDLLGRLPVTVRLRPAALRFIAP